MIGGVPSDRQRLSSLRPLPTGTLGALSAADREGAQAGGSTVSARPRERAGQRGAALVAGCGGRSSSAARRHGRARAGLAGAGGANLSTRGCLRGPRAGPRHHAKRPDEE